MGVRVWPELPGPPAKVEVLLVLESSTWGSVKLCRPVTVQTMRAKRMIGRIIGTVIRKKVRTGPAPSTRAASYSSVGMVCSPARKISAL